MNKLQLAIMLGFACGIAFIFGYVKTVFIPQYEEVTAPPTYEYIWPNGE